MLSCRIILLHSPSVYSAKLSQLFKLEPLQQYWLVTRFSQGLEWFLLHGTTHFAPINSEPWQQSGYLATLLSPFYKALVPLKFTAMEIWYASYVRCNLTFFLCVDLMQNALYIRSALCFKKGWVSSISRITYVLCRKFYCEVTTFLFHLFFHGILLPS